MTADPAVPVDESQTSKESAPVVEEITESQPLDGATASDLLEKFGVPKKLQEKYQPKETEEQPAPEGSPEAISLEPDPEPEKEPETEPEGEEDEEEVGAKAPDVAKLQKRNYKLRQRARRAEDEAAELRQKLEGIGNQEPVTVTPTMADPLSHVQTLDQLKAEKVQFKLLRDMARSKPNGWIANEGTASEVVVTPEQAAQYLSYAEDVLTENFPQKEKEIGLIRPASIEQAKKVLPTMLQRGTQDYEAYQTILRQYPFLATHPEKEAIASVILRGWKAIMADGKKSKEDSIPEKILQAAEQREKTPVQKQTPPGRSTAPGVPLAKKREEILAKVKRAGGDKDSMLAAMNEFDSINHGSNGSRDLAPV